MQNFGRYAPRERERMSHNVIASAAKQSIVPHKERMDCFAALAMTWRGRCQIIETVGWAKRSVPTISNGVVKTVGTA
jgi:hypothetical protein